MQTDIATLEALLDRVEKAEGLGGAERYRLDLAIYDALRLSGQVDCYTASIDAVIALVREKLPDREWAAGDDRENRRFWAAIDDDCWDEAMEQFRGFAKTAPLALLSALLTVLIAQSKEQAHGA